MQSLAPQIAKLRAAKTARPWHGSPGKNYNIVQPVLVVFSEHQNDIILWPVVVAFSKLHCAVTFMAEWNIMKHHEILLNIMKYYETLWNIMKHYKALWNIKKHYETLWNIRKHYGTLWNILKYYETLQVTVLLSTDPQRPPNCWEFGPSLWALTSGHVGNKEWNWRFPVVGGLIIHLMILVHLVSPIGGSQSAIYGFYSCRLTITGILIL